MGDSDGGGGAVGDTAGETRGAHVSLWSDRTDRHEQDTSLTSTEEKWGRRICERE